MMYKQRPQQVEAMRLSYDNAEEVAKWVGTTVVRYEDVELVMMAIPRGDQVGAAYVGDYIVKYESGEVIAIRPETFEAIYEPK